MLIAAMEWTVVRMQNQLRDRFQHLRKPIHTTIINGFKMIPLDRTRCALSMHDLCHFSTESHPRSHSAFSDWMKILNHNFINYTSSAIELHDFSVLRYISIELDFFFLCQIRAAINKLHQADEVSNKFACSVLYELVLCFHLLHFFLVNDICVENKKKCKFVWSAVLILTLWIIYFSQLVHSLRTHMNMDLLSCRWSWYINNNINKL